MIICCLISWKKGGFQLGKWGVAQQLDGLVDGESIRKWMKTRGTPYFREPLRHARKVAAAIYVFFFGWSWREKAAGSDRV